MTGGCFSLRIPWLECEPWRQRQYTPPRLLAAAVACCNAVSQNSHGRIDINYENTRDSWLQPRWNQVLAEYLVRVTIDAPHCSGFEPLGSLLPSFSRCVLAAPPLLFRLAVSVPPPVQCFAYSCQGHPSDNPTPLKGNIGRPTWSTSLWAVPACLVANVHSFYRHHTFWSKPIRWPICSCNWKCLGRDAGYPDTGVSCFPTVSPGECEEAIHDRLLLSPHLLIIQDKKFYGFWQWFITIIMAFWLSVISINITNIIKFTTFRRLIVCLRLHGGFIQVASNRSAFDPYLSSASLRSVQIHCKRSNLQWRLLIAERDTKGPKRFSLHEDFIWHKYLTFTVTKIRIHISSSSSLF